MPRASGVSGKFKKKFGFEKVENVIKKQYMSDFFVCFGIIELGLLLIPVLAYLFYKKFKTNIKYLVSLYSVIGLLGIARFFNLTFYGDLYDFILPIGVYFGYCILISFSLQINNRFLKLTLRILGLIPVIIGYIFATGGILGIMFIIGDLVPEKTVKINDKFYYREYSIGNVTSIDGGKEYQFSKQITLLPFIEKRILKQEISYLHYDTDSIVVKVDETKDQYKVSYFSKDKLQLYTVLTK